MNADGGTDRASVRGKRAVVLVALVVMAVFFGLSADVGEKGHYDHEVFLDTIEYERDGMGYYDAYRAAFEDRGVALSETRAVRQPFLFVVWRFIPSSLLWPAFILMVTITCVVLLTITEHPNAVLPVAAYLLLSGHIPTAVPVEQWLLVELWAVLPLAASIACWQRRRHAAAAAFAVVACSIRELLLAYVVTALVLAWRGDDPGARRAWSVATMAGVLLYGAHALAVRPYLSDVGEEAVLFGTAHPPRTVLEMAGWMLPGPPVIGFLILCVAAARLVLRRADVLPLLGILCLPAAGVVVSRPYWGFLFIPFALLLAGEQLSSWASRIGHRARTTSGPDRLPSSP